MKKELAISLMIGCLIVGLIAGYGLSKISTSPAAPGGAVAPPVSAALDPAVEQQIKFYKQIVDSDPKNREALVQLGNIYYDTGSYQNAVTYYERALVIKPNDANVLTDLGSCYRSLKQPDKAIELFQKAMKIDPKHPNSRYNLGIVLLHDKNDTRGAIAAFEEFLRLAPDSPNAVSLREQVQKMKQSLKG